MKRCKLTKLGRVANPLAETVLRGDGADGMSDDLPEVGQTFSMLASSPNPEATARIVSTSRIQKVEALGPNSYRFETYNSIYELEIFDG